MTHHAPIPPAATGSPASPEAPPRSNADYRWTHDKIADFLYVLAQCGKVAAAARAVGMSRQAAYRLRTRAPKLGGPWDAAQAIGRERRLARGRRRGGAAAPPSQGDASGAAR